MLLYVSGSYKGRFVEGVRQGFQLIEQQTSWIWQVTQWTLQLAFVATAVAVLVGLPVGCMLGLGRSSTSRVLLGIANTLTRVPPVAAGLVVLLMVRQEGPYGGGPLAGLHWEGKLESGYLAQALLAIPIVTALTASAVQGVPTVLLDQARAYGASRRRCATLAVREARRAVFAGVIVAMGVTITAIGALAVTSANAQTQQTTLAVEALRAFSGKNGFGDRPPADAVLRLYPTDSLAVAYAIVLIGLFLLIAAALTYLQEKRSSTWIPGLS